MNEATLTPADSKTGMTSIMALDAMSVSAGPNHAAGSEDDVSVAGVMLLSAMSVMMAIMAMVAFALVVIGCWWAVSHVPVPSFMHHLLAKLHMARG